MRALKREVYDVHIPRSEVEEKGIKGRLWKELKERLKGFDSFEEIMVLQDMNAKSSLCVAVWEVLAVNEVKETLGIWFE